MSLISFSKPSDSEVLNRIPKKNQFISFIGEGSVLQNVDETRYVRTVLVKLKKVETVKNIIYVKKGISWIFESVENASSA